jgi:hypothetical protein
MKFRFLRVFFHASKNSTSKIENGAPSREISIFSTRIKSADLLEREDFQKG